MTVVGVARLVSDKTRIIEVDGPLAAKTSQPYFGEHGMHGRPRSVSLSRLNGRCRRARPATGCSQRWPSRSWRRLIPGAGWLVDKLRPGFSDFWLYTSLETQSTMR